MAQSHVNSADMSFSVADHCDIYCRHTVNHGYVQLFFPIMHVCLSAVCFILHQHSRGIYLVPGFINSG